MSAPLKDLLVEWNAKLKASGFKDAEYAVEQNGWVKHRVITVNAEYYQHFEGCKLWLHYGTFKNDKHKLIFEKYCEGLSIRDTIDACPDEAFYPMQVSRVIKRILKDASLEHIEFRRV